MPYSGRGDRKGPDLKDVLNNRDKQWVYKQIADPEALVKSGDKIANELAVKFDRVMENPGLTPDQINNVMAFLAAPKEGQAAVAEAMLKAAEKSKGDAERGRRLFNGQLEFENGGSSCITCHSLPGLGFLGGGSLGIDLLTSELTAAEIASSLTNVNYKLMKDIYTDRPLSAEEVNDVVTFIQEAQTSNDKDPDDFWFVLLGACGVIVCFFIIQVLWSKRLKSVRKDLLNRSR